MKHSKLFLNSEKRQKTFAPLFSALEELLRRNSSQFDKIITDISYVLFLQRAHSPFIQKTRLNINLENQQIKNTVHDAK